MDIQQFLKVTNQKSPRPRIHCVDGFNVSVQAGRNLYSVPRIISTDYTAVELGYPSKVDSLIKKYAEFVDDPTGSVYPYVPIKVVEKLIAKHGGIDERKTFK